METSLASEALATSPSVEDRSVVVAELGEAMHRRDDDDVMLSPSPRGILTADLATPGDDLAIEADSTSPQSCSPRGWRPRDFEFANNRTPLSTIAEENERLLRLVQEQFDESNEVNDNFVDVLRGLRLFLASS